MRKIVIAPSTMHQDLLNFYRKEDPFFNIKIIDKKQIINDYFGYVLKGADIEVFKNFNLSYEMILEILKDIPFINNKKTDKYKDYYEIKEFLKKNDLFKENELFLNAYSNSEIDIYAYSKEDRLLNVCLSSIHSKISYIDNNKEIDNKIVYSFKYASDESLYVLNEISKLIDEGVKIEHIYIFNPSENHCYYLKKYMSSFGLKINNLDTKTYFTSGICVEFLKEYEKTRDIELSIESIKNLVKEDRDLDGFVELVNKNVDPSLSYEKQLSLLVYKFKNTYIPFEIYSPAINIIKGPILDKDAHIFVMNFSLGSAPIIIKDNGYLSDEEKEGTYIYTSKERNHNLRYELLYFLNSDLKFHFSYSNIVGNENTYPTSLISEYGFNTISNPRINTFYSSKLLDITYVQSLDLYDAYLQKSEELFGLQSLSNVKYKTYDNQFNGVSAIDNNTKIEFSFTSLDKYFSCPFKYYLSYVLKLGTFEETISLTIGNLIHDIFSHQYDKGFDFDECFDESIKDLELSAQDLFFINKLKSSFKMASDAARLHISKFSQNPNLYLEKELTYKIDENTYLYGKIDKIVSIDNRYFYVVDYKTGSKTFSFKHIDTGKDIQLVIYSILCESFEELDNLELGGLYINYVMPNELLLSSSEEDNIIPSYLKIKGATLNDIDYIERADKSFIGANQASFLHGVKLKSGGILASSAQFRTREELQKFKEIVKEIIKQANISIRNNDFKIAPKYYGKSDNGCTYCQYKDICYKRYEQFDFVINPQEEEDSDEVE